MVLKINKYRRRLFHSYEEEGAVIGLYKRSLFFLLIPGVIFLSQAAFAEEKADQKSIKSPTQKESVSSQTSPTELESIKVTDAHPREDLMPDSPTNPYRVESSARFGTEVFTQEDIQNLKPGDVNDLLDKATGMNVTYQGRRSPFFIETRGGGSFTYIIDGAVLPPSVNRILYKLPLAAIEELQIVRGSTSLTLGPSIPIGASGSGSGLNTGFIIIRTKQPRKTEAVLTGSVEKSIGGHPIATDVNLYLGTRLGDSPKINGYVGGMASMMDRPSQDSWFDGRNADNGMGNAGFTIGKFNMNFMGWTSSGNFEMQRGVKYDGTLDNMKWYYDPLQSTVLSTDMTMRWSPNQTTLLNVFKTTYDQKEYVESFINSSSSMRKYKEETRGIGLRHNARFWNTLIQLGGQMSESEGLGPNLSSNYNRYDTSVMGWSASVEQKLFNDRLVLDAGYRQDQKHIDNSSTSAAKDSANNDVDMDPAKIYALGARWRIMDIVALNGRYYHGEQGTSGDFDMRSQTGELHPEKQERMEFAIESDFKAYFRPMLTWFNIKTDNQKTATNTTYTLDSGTYYYYTEADNLRRGVELMIKGDILKNTSYSVSWTRMLKNEDTKNGVTTDNNGVSKPKNLYTLEISHKWRDYRANLSIKKVDSWYSSTSAMGTAEADLGDYTRVDANIKRLFHLKPCLLTATLYGRNLGDERYATRYSTGYYYDRGRTVGMELSLAY